VTKKVLSKGLNADAIDRADMLRLAATAQLDVRTVKRAYSSGVASLRAEVDKERLRNAAKELKLYIPE
jgi:hypothetical protein